MQRKIISFFTLVLTVLLSATVFFGCKEDTVEPVVIKTGETVTEDTTLLAYMTELENAGELDFELKDGMVTELNGKANTANSFWMLYTSDTANANTAWGSYEYEGQTLGSATLGAETLIIAKSTVYIWVYQSF